ncbi:MAG: hypothetical protein ABH828_00275 [archaeon]
MASERKVNKNIIAICRNLEAAGIAFDNSIIKGDINKQAKARNYMFEQITKLSNAEIKAEKYEEDVTKLIREVYDELQNLIGKKKKINAFEKDIDEELSEIETLENSIANADKKDMRGVGKYVHDLAKKIRDQAEQEEELETRRIKIGKTMILLLEHLRSED